MKFIVLSPVNKQHTNKQETELRTAAKSKSHMWKLISTTASISDSKRDNFAPTYAVAESKQAGYPNVDERRTEEAIERATVIAP